MSATVTRLPSAKLGVKRVKRVAAPKSDVTTSPRVASRQTKRQHAAGYAFAGLAFTLTSLSLSHLAEGVTLVAHRAAWEGWSVAVAIDVGFIVAEVAPFLVTAEAARDTKVARLGLSAAVLGASATFNAMAFSEAATSPGLRFAAMAIGVAMPVAIATFTHIATRFLVGRSK